MAASCLTVAISSGTSLANVPSLADVDATARASGNRIDVARKIGESVFGESWAMQISQISANELDAHLIVGVRLWGVKFHRAVTRQDFVDEVAAIVERIFAAAPAAEEVDVWASIPIEVGKGVIVSGDLAKPTTKTVFSLTAHRGETARQIGTDGDAADSADVFWDEEWARAIFEKREL